ncbi:MAG: heme exporter protein CcmD [Gammaproteobacteria bacterium]|nr:MAG: heme exporter protein CcmD [Gammaproteobacteria bacterium]
MSLSEFLHMGGYAPYVWPSYGIAALVLWWNLWVPARRLRQVRARLRRRLRREEASR